MTTIKQLANKLGLSKQAVYNRITKEPLRGILENTDGAIQVSAQGTILISDEGAAIVTKAYEEKYKHNISNRAHNTERTQSQLQSGEIEKLISIIDAVHKSLIEVLEQQQLSNAKLDKLL
jgi:predicted mannosyl-3-phosphoglycerate phosphatase (HAD superfamily)